MANSRLKFSRCNEDKVVYPSVVDVIADDNYRIHVEFDNKESGTLDMTPYLGFGVFSTLKDLSVFNTARVSFDTVEWENGVDLDPKFVYEKCVRCIEPGEPHLP
jgi:hypothetical protein